MRVALALVLAAVFGAGDQYLGSFSAHPWMTDASLLSAPWLVLAFLAGCTQRDPWRAALVGLACTFAALFGYAAMTLSPIENAQVSMTAVHGFIRSQETVLLGGLVTGPLFAWFGSRWRYDGAWWGALAATGALCLEPLARIEAGRGIRSSTVLLAEVGVGLALMAWVGIRTLAAAR